VKARKIARLSGLPDGDERRLVEIDVAD